MFYYLDEDEKKGREIDLIATDTISNDAPSVFIEYVLVCSVKKTSKPWIVFSTKASYLDSEVLEKISVSENINYKILPSEQFYAKSTKSKSVNYGHSYHISFQNNDLAIFDALSSSVKAFEQTKKMYQEMTKDEVREEKNHFLALFEPIIILDGQLFEAYLNSNNKTILKKINHIPICFGYISPQYKYAEWFGNYVVEITTLEELPKLLKSKKQWLEGIKNIMVQNINNN